MDSFVTSEELQLEKGPIQVRETGFLIWKRVIVPPNAFVVHTRIGHEKPVTIGLGVSFRYNPLTDAYLVVPAAMQTIGVVSNCISQEKQGINVLAYVQWQISDFSIAYRKLDFSDAADPLAIVNAQLREQADAAIKDKIATMTVSEVLTDKAPIIEELTRRLITVAEGRFQTDTGGDDEGLGIKIVTVQLKEALVSSTRLWEHLQAPFRHEQERNARLSYLDMQEEIRIRELATRQSTQTSEAEAKVSIERVRQTTQTEEIELKLQEEEKRRQRQQEMQSAQLLREQQAKIETARAEGETQAQLRQLEIDRELQAAEENRRLAAEKAQIERERYQSEVALREAIFNYDLFIQQNEARIAADQQQAQLELDRQRTVTQAEIEQVRLELEQRRAQVELEADRLRREIENLVSSELLVSQWIEQLPELADHMPDVEHMNVLHMGNQEDSIGGFLAQQMTLFNALRDFLNNRPSSNGTSRDSDANDEA